jgi:hypothetical protein
MKSQVKSEGKTQANSQTVVWPRTSATSKSGSNNSTKNLMLTLLWKIAVIGVNLMTLTEWNTLICAMERYWSPMEIPKGELEANCRWTWTLHKDVLPGPDQVTRHSTDVTVQWWCRGDWEHLKSKTFICTIKYGLRKRMNCDIYDTTYFVRECRVPRSLYFKQGIINNDYLAFSIKTMKLGTSLTTRQMGKFRFGCWNKKRYVPPNSGMTSCWHFAKDIFLWKFKVRGFVQGEFKVNKILCSWNAF